MKKIYFLILFSFFLLSENFAQGKEKQQFTEHVTKLTFLEPGIAHEFPVGRVQSFFLRTGMTATLANDNYNEEIAGVLLRLFGSASFRVYYNSEKRLLDEKNVSRNSANYFALLFLSATKPLNSPDFYYDQRLNNALINAGLVWGIQRNFPSRFSLDLNIGLGYVKAGSLTGLSPLGELNLGFWLGKKTQ
jgi:hypothetical protein